MIKCNFIRGEATESTHSLCAIVIDSNKNILYSCGNAKLSIPARSTLKPFQSAASLKEGTADFYNFADREIAVT